MLRRMIRPRSFVVGHVVVSWWLASGWSVRAVVVIVTVHRAAEITWSWLMSRKSVVPDGLVLVLDRAWASLEVLGLIRG